MLNHNELAKLSDGFVVGYQKTFQLDNRYVPLSTISKICSDFMALISLILIV